MVIDCSVRGPRGTCTFFVFLVDMLMLFLIFSWDYLAPSRIRKLWKTPRCVAASLCLDAPLHNLTSTNARTRIVQRNCQTEDM